MIKENEEKNNEEDRYDRRGGDKLRDEKVRRTPEGGEDKGV